MDIVRDFIGGELVEPTDVDTLQVTDPAVNESVGRVSSGSIRHLNEAVSVAQRAFGAWSSRSAQRRADVLIELADLIDENLEELARIESQDTGKPVALARTVDIPRAAQNFRFFAHAITQFGSESHAMAEHAINYTRRDPSGVVGVISPWNLPLYLLTWKIAPALAAGNCVIAKPSEMTPLSAQFLGKLCQQVDLPPGVVNIVNGTGENVGAPLCSHPDVGAISFTGGTSSGRQVASRAGAALKKVSLELGGKNPALVFADCDFDSTLDQLVRASFANQGQICLCPSRIYVEAPIYEKFKAQFVERVSQLRVGDPLESVDQGSVISASHQNKIFDYVQLAKEEGGEVLVGGEPIKLTGRCERGAFFAPTVIEALPIESRLNQEEIFGPVITIAPFKSEQEVLQLANATSYGLAATIWTQALGRAHRLAQALQFGLVWINCWMLRDLRTPFGGMKDSGVGREGGMEALRFFTEPKNVCIAYGNGL